jgi:predicted Rossmann fold nucleotide-binding protein DprA/Smf involved in DNA uptake
MTFITCKFGTQVMPEAPERKIERPRYTMAELAAIENAAAGFSPKAEAPKGPRSAVIKDELTRRILQRVTSSPRLSKEMAEEVGISTKQAVAPLRRLEALGLIERVPGFIDERGNLRTAWKLSEGDE